MGNANAGVELGSEQAGQVFGESIGEVSAGGVFAVAAEPFAFGEPLREVEVLALERTSKLSSDEEYITDGTHLAREDAVGETLDGKCADEGAVRAAADVATHDT